MDNVTRRMRRDFEAFFPRAPEVRTTIEGEGVLRWLSEYGLNQRIPVFDGVQLIEVSATISEAKAGFVFTRVYEQPASPSLHLRRMLDALDALPDAVLLMDGSAEISLSFVPGR